jgi:hypothetical protein
MIYGNGLLAKGFKTIEKTHPNVVFLCSGVSGSIVEQESCDREYNLVKNILNNDEHFVYTSSFHVKQNTYFNHKLKMEELVGSIPNHTIVRIGSLVYYQQSSWQFFPAIVKQIEEGFVKIHNCRKDIVYLFDYINFVDLLLRTKKSILTSFGSKSPPFVSEIVDYIEFKKNKVATKTVIHSDDVVSVPEFTIPGKYYYQSVIDLGLK